MPSEAELKKQRAESAAADLKAAKEAAPSPEAQAEMLTRVPPLVRDEDHSFVEQEPSEFTAEELQPDLTKTGTIAGLTLSTDLTERDYKGVDGAKITARIDEHTIERMSDEQIKASGLLSKPTELVHPARLAPTSERQRTPYQRSPAAGPGSWPVPEDQLPAVMPSDPPVEDRLADAEGDNTFAGVSGFSQAGTSLKLQGVKSGTTLKIEKNQVKAAAALYLRLRQQFPHFTTEMLNDEFAIQFEGAIGASQSFRETGGLSQHGDTAVGDPRVTFVDLGKQRLDASEAQPEPSTPSVPSTSAGLPSQNEPSSRAPDDAKAGSTSTDQDKADAKAAEQIAKFDHDGDGNVGGSKPAAAKTK